jgi:hypothetical protein
MKFKNNWDAILPSKQQIKAKRLVEKQKKLTAEELFEDSEKAYAAMVAQQAFEAKKHNIKLKDREK